MQIVIKMPDKTYEKIMSNEYDYGDMNVIIQNGTPLPKGHGRLIDASRLFKKLFINQNGSIVPDRDVDNFEVRYGVHFMKTAIHEAQTVIEADKGDD